MPSKHITEADLPAITNAAKRLKQAIENDGEPLDILNEENALLNLLRPIEDHPWQETILLARPLRRVVYALWKYVRDGNLPQDLELQDRSIVAITTFLKATGDEEQGAKPRPAEVTAGPGERGTEGDKPKQRRGRPKGGATKGQALKLFREWKAANNTTSISKLEFLRERGLPESDLDTLERGRKQDYRRRKAGRK